MFNPLNLLSKIIKSGNQKELDRISKIVNRINSLEKKFENIDNSDFPKKTSELISRLNDGENINQILPEAFAFLVFINNACIFCDLIFLFHFIFSDTTLDFVNKDE